MQKILLIEDEPSIADTIVYALQGECFDVAWVSTGAAGLEQLTQSHFDCVVLDIGLPDMLGYAVCREIRRISRVPVLFLSARDSEMDRVLGLELGGDDYVVKPFSPRELAARVRAILRRVDTHHASLAAVQIAPHESTTTIATPEPRFFHDTDRKCVFYGATPLPLTHHEYLLMVVLLASPGRVYSRDQLMDAAWEDPTSAMDRTVDAHVKSLRAKIRVVAPELNPIHTHRGLGYSFVESGPAPFPAHLP